MTILAGIVDATALQLDCDDVDGLVVVCATGLWTDVDPADFRQVLIHTKDGNIKDGDQPTVSSSS